MHSHNGACPASALHPACPQDTEWVVVTNGDNLYDPAFLEVLTQPESDRVDIVAFDYYSRYQRPTGGRGGSRAAASAPRACLHAQRSTATSARAPALTALQEIKREVMLPRAGVS